jgi:predicted transcriptional regulator
MLSFFSSREAAHQPLGPLEIAVMEIVWSRGESAVRDVVDSLERPLAYTTVMTTLDRLYKKGLLARRKHERAFLYSGRLTRGEWERKRAGELMAGLLTSREPGRELLISCLVDAVGHDEELLNELERRIKERRRELKRS